MAVVEEGEEVVEEERSSDTLTYRSFPRHTRTRMCVCIMCVRVCVCVLENSNIFDHYLGTIPTVIPAPPVTFFFDFIGTCDLDHELGAIIAGHDRLADPDLFAGNSLGIGGWA